MNKLIPINYENQRVLTTKQLAEVYRTDKNNIQSNFKNHKNNFKEGKHYFLLQGEELKEFKSYLNNIQTPINKFTSSLYLWTERGANRHCKILDTDKAWEQFDNLEETYFDVKNQLLQPQSIDIANQMLGLAQSTQMMAQVVQGIQGAIGGIQTYVQDSIQAKDKQIDDIAELVGLRSRNVQVLTGALKKAIEIKYNVFNVNANMEIYKKH